MRVLVLEKKQRSINSRTPYFNVKTSFGWPFLEEMKGKYWTNENTYSEVIRLFNYIRNVSKNEWDNEVKNFRKNILNYNENNSLLLKELNLK